MAPQATVLHKMRCDDALAVVEVPLRVIWLTCTAVGECIAETLEAERNVARCTIHW
jgi:hypothetical protein